MKLNKITIFPSFIFPVAHKSVPSVVPVKIIIMSRLCQIGVFMPDKSAQVASVAMLATTAGEIIEGLGDQSIIKTRALVTVRKATKAISFEAKAVPW